MPNCDTNQICSNTSSQEFCDDVLHGLSGPSKALPCKYLYDQNGSQLFDQICEQPEYYLTKAELEIMQASTAEMMACLPDNTALLEYGSGSSLKTRLLLQNNTNLSAYLPVDISAEHLTETARGLRSEFPEIYIEPIVADFTREFTVPISRDEYSVSVYFPGSTIGNFEPSDARELMRQINLHCSNHGGLLIGFDLVKDSATLHAAYNDAAGITANFNLNLLHRINRELDANFVVEQFEHLANFNEEQSRIEIYLRSKTDQQVSIAGRAFSFASGEKIHTEYSHKYSLESFSELGSQSGWKLERHWTDANQHFAVAYLTSTQK